VTLSAPAAAHVFLRLSSPGAGETLVLPPTRVRLDFSEAIAGPFATVRVFNDRGIQVDRGPVALDGTTAAVDLSPSLRRGTYVVHWRVVGQDGHPVSDAFVFHVSEPTSTTSVTEPSDRSGLIRGIFRWTSLLLLAVLLGWAIFGGDSLGRIALLTLASLTGLLVADAMGLSGLSFPRALEFGVLTQVLRTQLGIVRLIQIALVLAALLPLGRLRFLPIAGALAAEAFAGHAPAAPLPATSVLVQATHLVAMGTWVGGVVAVMRKKERLPRYRRVAFWAVGVVIATGIYNSWAQVGTLDRLTSTLYGRILLAKVGLLGLVLILAILNRKRGLDPLRIRLETGGLFAIVALAAALGGIAPARAGQGPFSEVFSLGPWRASFVVDPAQVGENEVHLFLLSGPGELALDVASADAEVFPSRGQVGAANLNLEEEGAGHYVVKTPLMVISGPWTALITARHDDGSSYQERIDFMITP
jgi:copper transport protein